MGHRPCCCDCAYTFKATLDWGTGTAGLGTTYCTGASSTKPDLDLYVKVDANATCYFGALTNGGVTLAEDIWPCCAGTNSPPEITQGNFTASHDFHTWYNQFSDCALEKTPTVTKIEIINTGNSTITVDGTPLTQGNTRTINSFAYSGYKKGPEPNYASGTLTSVVC